MSDLLKNRFKELQDDTTGEAGNAELEQLKQELLVTKEFVAETSDALARYRVKLKNISVSMVKYQTWLSEEWYEVCRELYLNNKLETLFTQIEADIAFNKISMYEVQKELKAIRQASPDKKNIHLAKVPLALKLRFDDFQEKYKINPLRMIIYYKLHVQKNGN